MFVCILIAASETMVRSKNIGSGYRPAWCIGSTWRFFRQGAVSTPTLLGMASLIVRLIGMVRNDQVFQVRMDIVEPTLLPVSNLLSPLDVFSPIERSERAATHYTVAYFLLCSFQGSVNALILASYSPPANLQGIADKCCSRIAPHTINQQVDRGRSAVSSGF